MEIWKNHICFFVEEKAETVEMMAKKNKNYIFLGNIFEGFTEAEICFPPTHKFIIGTDEYVCNRIPSYTVS